VIGANDQLLKSDDHARLIVAYRGGAPVVLSEVADVRIAPMLNVLLDQHPRDETGSSPISSPRRFGHAAGDQFLAEESRRR
jgi:hypothetical protein